MEGGDKMAEKIHLDKACGILGAAAGGTFTYNSEFKAACLLGVKIIRSVQKVFAAVIAAEADAGAGDSTEGK